MVFVKKLSQDVPYRVDMNLFPLIEFEINVELAGEICLSVKINTCVCLFVV